MTKYWRRRVGEEREFGEILLTRIKRKPPVYKCETTDDNGNPVVVALEKMPKGTKGWVVRLPKDEASMFKTRRQALNYVLDLQVQKVEEPKDDGKK